MFLIRNKKNNVYPCKPQIYYIKVGFKVGKNYIGFRDVLSFLQENCVLEYNSQQQKMTLIAYYVNNLDADHSAHAN